MQACYEADTYFERLDSQFIDDDFKYVAHELPYWRGHRWAWTKRCFFNYAKFTVVASRLIRQVSDESLRSRYKQQLRRVIRARWREPHILFIYAIKVASHYHYAELTRAMGAHDGSGEMPDAGRSFSRAKRRVPAQEAA